MDKLFTSIKNQFSPIQPTVGSTGGNVTYVEATPAIGLSNLVHCYWELKTGQPLSQSFVYRVVADGCIDLLWETANPSDNFIIGFSNSYTEFPLNNSFHYFGLRFLPSAFPILFGVAASELTDRFAFLEEVLPSLSKEIAEVADGVQTLGELKPKLDAYLLKVLGNSDLVLDPRFGHAVSLILQSKGLVKVQEELDTGISPRQLRRLFSFYIGESPKTFAKIVRFQQFLNAKPSKESLRKNKVFYDAGYYDHAHFVKEFKHMYGETPSSALH
ncbi:helix-turn-helix domain-containing protein [Flammeovirgaceae bacterium SG7u.111]|nr:helix-turn-helix domain-containing protein [Flammeovirgaceae bacterium SG7u.132]WPO33614.1 helix-turn-helix domain-containing protein [Flammeovirgaceae bacterium SG7u.111]